MAWLDADYRLPRKRDNRYLQDREEMKHTTYAGLGRNFYEHDKYAVESQGMISDRSTEFLGVADRAVVMMRRQMLQAIETVRSGGDPPLVSRKGAPDPLADMVVRSQPLPASVDINSRWWAV